MLKSKVTQISALFSLLLFVFLPITSWSGVASFSDSIDQTDAGSSRIVAFWDTRGRSSSFQVANISNSSVDIHVQIFNVPGGIECTEFNFDDTLTPSDVHTYDLLNLVSNTDIDLADQSLDSYGLAVVSIETGPANSLVGVMRILDELGYEYRANMAGESSSSNFATFNTINFSKANGNNLSDLVGITYVEISSDTVYASPGVSTVFGNNFPGTENTIWDDLEDDVTCSPTSFSCAMGQVDRAIDNSLPNSKGQVNSVCATSILDDHDSGWLQLPFDRFECTDPIVGTEGVCDFTPYFVGFIGLNNGDGTGSFDSWWSTEELVN